jgi:hypothetical protein
MSAWREAWSNAILSSSNVIWVVHGMNQCLCRWGKLTAWARPKHWGTLQMELISTDIRNCSENTDHGWNMTLWSSGIPIRPHYKHSLQLCSSVAFASTWQMTAVFVKEQPWFDLARGMNTTGSISLLLYLFKLCFLVINFADNSGCHTVICYSHTWITGLMAFCLFYTNCLVIWCD